MHLQAAEGWLELGNHSEANEELEKITLENREHPAVLQVRWQICGTANKWEAALDIASTIIQLLPEHSLGWIHRSFALHELNRTAEARDNLLPAVERFPDEPILRYNLACYECRLGRLEQARL
jgi:predicted Zn-dependent protease